MEPKPERDWFTETGFCNMGCGMLGVNHAENDALCRRRRQERYELPNCALIYIPSKLAAQVIAEGRLRQEDFLAKTPDGYRPLPTRSSGRFVQFGVTDADAARDS